MKHEPATALRRGKRLEFPVPAFVPTAAYVETDAGPTEADLLIMSREDWEEEKKTWTKSAGTHKGVDTTPAVEVELPQSPMTGVGQQLFRSRQMTLTLKGLSKNGKTAFYSGGALVQRYVVKGFEGGTAPQTIDVPDGVFAAPKQPKVKETKEERKARLAALPKPTLAEKIAKREKQLEKDKAKLAAADASI